MERLLHVRKRRSLSLLLTGVVISTFALVASGTPANAEDYVGVPIQLINFGSGKCFQMTPQDGNEMWDGLLIQQRVCDGSDEQVWYMFPAGNGPYGLQYYLLVNHHSNKCLDVRDGSPDDWTVVQQWTCTASTSMYWSIWSGGRPNTYQFINARNTKCLDVAWGSHDDYAQLQQFHCTDLSNLAQVWALGPIQPGPQPVTVPDEVDSTCTQAVADVRALGLVGTCAGTGSYVGNQSPGAGTQVQPGSTVSFNMVTSPV
jgi:hypothetical protein